MDVKDLRTETALSERNNDGSKYSQGGVALPCNRNKSYQDIGSNPLAKTEPAPVRPCAVIGPDRVVPPPASNDAFLKKGPVEPWPGSDNLYRRPHEYPHKLISGNQNPTRNISPRQTFQEHMQRITVPPTYSAVRHSDDPNFNNVQDRNVAMVKNIKPNVPSQAKYCDVPYGINTTKELKNIRDNDIYMQSVNSVMTRTAPHGWPPAGVSVHAPRSYGAHELYQYPYPNCPGQRPPVIPLARPHRTLQEDPAYAYSDHYQDASAHYKAFQTMKERYPQGRYEYIPNYPSQFHPSPLVPPQKYDIPKPSQPHPYPVYPHLKYLDNRVPDHNIEGFQRPTNQQPHYNVQFRNQVIHPTYAPVPGNSSQNKSHPYPPDGAIKTMASNKLPYDSTNKMFIDYENSRTKAYPPADNYFVNEMGRVHPVKNQMVMPNYSPSGMHAISSQQYYRKENPLITKPFDYMQHFKNFDPTMHNNPMMRHTPQFSPNTLAISSSDSSTSNDTTQTHGTFQEDCGYVSQSSTASLRSVDSGMYRLPHEYYKRYDFRYGPTVRSSPTLTKSENCSNDNSKDNKQKQIDVRQFLQMWNEDGMEEENSSNNNPKEIVIQTGSSEPSTFLKQHSNQDQLYVLGLVNVPSEELSKYEHIQKISKLPENIKGYNTLELLSQFEEAIESSNTPSFKPISKEYQMSSKVNSPKQVVQVLPRPVSPLDVEAKISQSVIHKEVGCNFEIRPCSPKMLNVEVAAPAQNILGELMIEKVKNPLSNIVKSPKPIKHDENSNCHTIRLKENSFAITDNPSCKMIRSPFASNNMDSVKTNYSLQDLEINSGVCLASLPRLDNEIELSFPEVNQQFINANKKDDNTTSKCSTPNNLEEEFGFSDNKSVTKDKEKCESVMGDDSEKMYTKLSKYRKLKTNTTDDSQKYQPTQAVRTDSVIIKNPENLKNIEDKLLESGSNTPMNLSSQSGACRDLPTNICENSKGDLDVALDFSLNKSVIDLPIIDTEKDELTRSLNTNLPYVSYKNISAIDSIKSCIKKTNNDENVLNSKNYNSKCIEPDEEELKSNDQCVQNELDSKNSEHIIEPVILSDDTHTLDLDNACNSVSVSGNSPLASANIDVIQEIEDRNVNDVKEFQKKDDHYDTCKDTIVSINDDNSTSCDLAQEFVSSKYTEIDSAYNQSIETMHIGNPLNEAKKTSNDVKADISKYSTSSQSHNDFENDEISASLEKLFRDSDDDSAHMDSDNDSIAKPISLPCKVLYHQNKELFSPWIQKLLTHSEGSCYKSKRQSKRRDSLKSILNYDEDNAEETLYDTLKAEHSRDIDVDEEYEKTILAHTDENETFFKETIEDSSSKVLRTVRLESYKIFRQDDTASVEDVNVCITIESKANAEIKASLEKSSNEVMDDIICSTNLEVMETSPSYLKDSKSKQLQACKFDSETSFVSKIKTSQSFKEHELKLFEDPKADEDNNPNFNVQTIQNSLKESESKLLHDSKSEPDTNLDFEVKRSQNHSKKSEPMRDNAITVSKADSQEDSNSTLEKITDFVITDTKMNGDKDAEVTKDNENIINITNELEEEDTSYLINKLDNEDEDKTVTTCFEKVSMSASDNCTGQQNKENSKCSTENVVSNLGSEKSISTPFNDNDINREFKNMIQEEFTKVRLEKNIDVTDIFSLNKFEGYENVKKSIETVNKRHDIEDTGETSTTFDKSCTFYELANIHQKTKPPQCAQRDDSGRLHENQNVESQGKRLTKRLRSLPGKLIDIECNKTTDILPSPISIIPIKGTSDIDSSNCTQIHTPQTHSVGVLVKDKIDCEIDNIPKEENLSECNNVAASPNSVFCAESKSEAGQNEENYLENKISLIDTCNEAIASLAGTGDILTNDNKSCYTLQNTPDSIPEPATEHTKYKNESIHEPITDTAVSPTRSPLSPKEHHGINSSMNTTSNYNTSDTWSDFQKDNTGSLQESSDVAVVEHIGSHPIDENESHCDIETTTSECSSDTRTDHPKQVNELLQNDQDGIKCVAEDITSKCISDTLKDETNIVKDDKSQFSIESCATDVINVCYQVIENNEVQRENNPMNFENQEFSIQNSPLKRRSLKRAFSDSALNSYKNRDGPDRQVTEPFIWPSKRQRMYGFENSEQHVIDESLCNLIQNNRRNSISAFCNEQNVSFCILIDNNCILTEENEEDKICFAEVSEGCIAEINTTNQEDNEDEVICCSQENELGFSEAIVLNYDNEKTIQESWLDDVACVETVVSDDIEDDVVIGDHMSPRDIEVSEYDESGIYSCDLSENLDEVNFLNDENVCDIVAQNIEIYRSPGGQMEEVKLNSNENFVSSESPKIKVYPNIRCHVDDDKALQNTDEISTEVGDDMFECHLLENNPLDSTFSRESLQSPDYTKSLPETTNSNIPENKENIFKDNRSSRVYESYTNEISADNGIVENKFSKDVTKTDTSCHANVEDVNSCESIKDDIFSYTKPQNDEVCFSTSSSPEVSSTTFEDKSSSILLKITNYNGSRVSEVNEVKHNKPRCKFTEKKEYSNSYGIFPKRPLITKAAQKYIPPLKESICDLKVKLTLPQQRLLKLKQLKLTRSELKQTTHNINSTLLKAPTKPKPNFEDVLKSIDEVQIKKLKEKNKKVKNVIPKVVIKKNLNGSHYTSSLNKNNYNPDLTGRKWQPWVFLEKNHFIDQMAIGNKTKAIYNHRNNTYVLAEKFKKYKSVNNCSAKFVISQPKTSDSSKGQLKYTIRLKHIY